jgi:hypothetical protein
MTDTTPELGVHQECRICCKPRWAHKKEVMCYETGYELLHRCEHGAIVRILNAEKEKM